MKSALLLAAVALTIAGCRKAEAPVPPPEAPTVPVEASVPAGGTWADVVNQTPQGGYMMGNPAAKVKLIEIASLSCPYCRQFEEAGVPSLVDRYVKTGQVSWEFRPYLIHGPIDMAATLVARCNGPKGFFPLSRALYKDQATWVEKVESAPKDKVEAIQAMPPGQAFVAMADIMGLQSWAAARGVPHAKSAQCLSDQAMIAAEVQNINDVSAQYPDFSGTPSFVVDGKLQPREASNWAALEPILQAALR